MYPFIFSSWFSQEAESFIYLFFFLPARMEYQTLFFFLLMLFTFTPTRIYFVVLHSLSDLFLHLHQESVFNPNSFPFNPQTNKPCVLVHDWKQYIVSLYIYFNLLMQQYLNVTPLNLNHKSNVGFKKCDSLIMESIDAFSMRHEKWLVPLVTYTEEKQSMGTGLRPSAPQLL